MIPRLEDYPSLNDSERSAVFRRKYRALDNAEKEQRMNMGFSVIVFARLIKIDTFSEMPEVLLKGNELLS
jgi:hypothetical protein